MSYQSLHIFYISYQPLHIFYTSYQPLPKEMHEIAYPFIVIVVRLSSDKPFILNYKRFMRYCETFFQIIIGLF